MKKIILTLCLSSLFLLQGCKVLEDMKQEELKKKIKSGPNFTISIHQIVKYPRAEKLEREVQAFSGRKLWINTNPFLHSRNIKRIELVERDNLNLVPKKTEWGEQNKKQKIKKKRNPKEPKFYDLKLYFTRRGSLAWMQLSAAYRHDKLALLIDGVFYRTFTPNKMYTQDDEYAILEGPIDETCAFLIKDHSKKNYKHFNKYNNREFNVFEDILK